VLLLPVEIAGYASRVRDGFRENGWEADVLDLTGDPMGYGAAPPPERSMRLLHAAYLRFGALGAPGLAVAGIVLLPLRVLATVTAVRHRDLLVYLFGRTLFGGLDVRLARAAGVRTVTIYLGSDSRPPWMNGNYLNVAGQVRWPLVRFRTWQTARRVRFLERHTDVVVCHPATAQLLSRPCVNWLAVGMPVDQPERSVVSAPADGPLRVVHAPSRRRQKGSDRIEAAMAALAAGGCDLRFTTLTGLQNSEVRRELAGADLVLDELYSDTFLGGIGVEAAAAGVPTLVFGLAADYLRPYAEALGIPHEHYATPDQLDEVLRRAADDPAWRRGLATAVQEYVRTAATPAGVAERIARAADGDVPASWVVDPAEVDYVLGFGMPREVAHRGLRDYVRRYGEAALHLPTGSRALDAVRAIVSAGEGTP
jgi:hypothetical protein